MASSSSYICQPNFSKNCFNTPLHIPSRKQCPIPSEEGSSLFFAHRISIVSELEFIDGEYVFVYVNNLIPNYQFQLNEIRGRIISDYQDYLESNWLEYLFRTYDITVDWDLLKTLVSE